ncbi:Ig-like domain-containing protein [Marmoricola sp. RAF53]|uniref:Ig-like domain-containing protein n=1 Tax=Marmoricola sp. RAF53 TaxID=3233059 RepID=UPI003F9B9AA0
MTRRWLPLMALAAVLGVVAFGLPGLSSATFTSTSTNAISTVSAANDWTPPTVSVRTPATPAKDTVTVTADAADDRSGIASVTIQLLAPGATGWTTLCTTTAAPYSCSWSTRSGADGEYALRAVATDDAGYATTSDSVTTTVANNLLVVLGDPGDVVRGNVGLTATLYNAGILPYTVAIQYAVSGTTTWKNVCTNLLAPYTCTWNTAGSAFTQGESYDLRAVATLGTSSTTSALVSDVLVDNIAPSVTMTDPGTPLRGTVTFAATATDAESGVAQVLLQYQRSGTGTWTTLCTSTVEPFSCRYATTQLTDGTYAFRAVATDDAGNSTTSATVANRVVDNTVSTVSMEDPGAYLNGTVTLTASANSSAGVTSVRIERAPNGGSTWTAVCTDTAAPYTCALDTTTLTDGLYDFRAVLLDGAGKNTTSAVVSARRVDNSPLRGYDVQTVNGGAKAGRLETGDQLKLTYSEDVTLSSITSGWSGSSLAVSLRLRDGKLVGGGTNSDTVDVLRNGSAVNLGSVNLAQNFVKNGKTVQFNATMVASTATVNGSSATVVTITLGSVASGSGLRTVSATATMLWTPSALVTELATGRAASTAPTSERGTLDRDF